MWRATLVSIGLLIQTADLVNVQDNPEIILPSSNPMKCISKPGEKPTGTDKRFEVLPGVGFDNLRNLNAGQVSLWTYNECKTTEDGKYILPDSVFTIPMKASTVEVFAEIFQHWSSYKSATSSSINLGGGGGISGVFDVSGKFSKDFQSVKTHQYEEKSITTRVQIRHVFYTAKLQPDSALHPTFKQRLMDIAAHLQNNNTAVARYLGELLVRDYGTHVVTSVDSGAALVKEDHVKNTFLNNTENSKSQISASASASFFSVVHFDAGYSNKDSERSEQQYMGNITHSQIKTYGGPAFHTNFTIASWEEGLTNELVAIDRAGDPLHFSITSATLPELPDPTIQDLAELVKSSIAMYYKFNTYAGCTKESSPNFCFQANIDDSSCKPPLTNFTFGGIYQTCTNQATSAGNICLRLSQKNPLSGDFSCPTGYQSILLHKGTQTSSVTKWVCQNKCRHCGWWSRCCHNECGNRKYGSSASYSAYWCAAEGRVASSSGYLFGGLYTSKMSNPVTGTNACPLTFYPLTLTADLHVCVSDDYEEGTRYSLPFAGFFSCLAGNPLSASSALSVSPALRNGAAEKLTLGEFVMISGPQVWRKACPRGFSQHLATVDDSCEINYCVQMGALDGAKLPDIRRPPFTPKPSDNPNTTETLIIYGVSGKVWIKNETTNSWMRIDKKDDPSVTKLLNEKFGLTWTAIEPVESEGNVDGSAGLSAGGAAGIAVVATVVCGLLVLAIVHRLRRRRQGLDDSRPILPSNSSPHVADSYGAANIQC